MLKVMGVSRSFGTHRVLDEISFNVRPGRMTGFLGANGSGKTTTMRIILGVLAPHGGTVTWNDEPITQPVRQTFGYMPEERGLYPKMKVAEQIQWLGQLHGLSSAKAKANTADLLEQLELTERGNDMLEQLSLGNQQRAQIAAALVHEPTAMILDEPFSGLDPIAVDTVLKVLRERASSGVPVLFSSHQLAVVERLCDDLVIISGGQIKASGGREELRAKYGTTRFELVVDSDAGWLRDHPGVRVVDVDGPRAVFEVDPLSEQNGQTDQRVLESALSRGAVRSFSPVVPSLEEIFKEAI
ncbi:ATP-binding cassette domain-containing protein [Kibdelosporangium philippinense]|uniref:ATP-binding cassette domain-containing protein n=1 Tax=Kibdelosporangium philippinense TaxID=211113 RepID=A0ABS8ZCB8_9PSEU|nr:ATP-binding cassette domain-containing protein [Kibdelosporangium philippinense]MCE7004173.1 ATP-binding cassette domain-containing protein [Kibdelosporangium philippinense]